MLHRTWCLSEWLVLFWWQAWNPKHVPSGDATLWRWGGQTSFAGSWHTKDVFLCFWFARNKWETLAGSTDGGQKTGRKGGTSGRRSNFIRGLHLVSDYRTELPKPPARAQPLNFSFTKPWLVADNRHKRVLRHLFTVDVMSRAGWERANVVTELPRTLELANPQGQPLLRDRESHEECWALAAMLGRKISTLTCCDYINKLQW